MSDIEKSAQTQSNEPAEPSFRYNADLAQGIEEKWQKIWDDEGTFWAANVNGDLKDGKGRNAEGRPSYFAMDMFPYPSGKGLHVGHPLGYLATDVVSRYHRMKGENVLHAMGYDAFGLPAEQYAVQTGQHPRITTEQNIANMRRQLHRMGLSFDNRRSFATIDPGYVRWTQWIFSRIYDSWYDEDATNPSGSKGCARPISTLVEQFESGEREIPGFAGKQWNDLTEAEQADVLNDFDTLKVAVAYNVNGKETSEFPYEASEKIVPVYKEFKGWNCDINKLRRYDEFPTELKNYIEFIEQETGVPVKIVSVGPDREETIVR